MRLFVVAAVIAAVIAAVVAPCALASQGRAGSPSTELCPRPAVGAVVTDPVELRSSGGSLTVNLAIHSYRTAAGVPRYCYRTPDGHEAPTLRVRPGDRVTLHLSNHLMPLDDGGGNAMAMHAHTHSAAGPVGASTSGSAAASTPGAAAGSNACSGGVMTATSTNLHFHGMTLPPVCHQDEVLNTSIQPGDPPFEYHFQVPENEPPGLYWYHPHIHGFSSKQVTGGASGALIVEGLERAIPEVAGLPERVFVIRDLDLMNPDATPSSAEPVVPRPTLDSDGDIANNNTGYGKPARDLSINFVPAPYPDYPPATIVMKPKERQLWRVLNAGAITYLHLTLLYAKVPQSLGVVAIDGVPINQGDAAAPRVTPVDHIALPPGSRVEFVVEGPAMGTRGLLITRVVNTGQDGENVPNRPLASIETLLDPSTPATRLPLRGAPLPVQSRPWVGSVTPVRTRKFYFSERRSDPSNPKSPTVFFITVDGETPKAFDPAASLPNIVVKQGDVEDWVIENRSLELHAFHIHQIHFQLREWFGYEVDEPFLRDTVSVPFFDNHMTEYPSVRLRLDFRGPNTVGTFAYHCHLLEHEDGGMMGVIRVDPMDPVDPVDPVNPVNPEHPVDPANFPPEHSIRQ
jgi:FtsP/CotA-like multicopper oxidase with cupredoxin domain